MTNQNKSSKMVPSKMSANKSKSKDFDNNDSSTGMMSAHVMLNDNADAADKSHVTTALTPNQSRVITKTLSQTFTSNTDLKSRKSPSCNTNISSQLIRDIESNVTINREYTTTKESCNNIPGQMSKTSSRTVNVHKRLSSKSMKPDINVSQHTDVTKRQSKILEDAGVDSELMNFVNKEVKRLTEHTVDSSSGGSMDLNSLVNRMVDGVEDGKPVKKQRRITTEKIQTITKSSTSNADVLQVKDSKTKAVDVKPSNKSVKEHRSVQSVNKTSPMSVNEVNREEHRSVQSVNKTSPMSVNEVNREEHRSVQSVNKTPPMSVNEVNKGDDNEHGLDVTLLKYVNNEVNRIQGKSEDSSVVSADLSILNNEYKKVLAGIPADELAKIKKSTSNTSSNTVKKNSVPVDESKSIVSNNTIKQARPHIDKHSQSFTSNKDTPSIIQPRNNSINAENSKISIKERRSIQSMNKNKSPMQSVYEYNQDNEHGLDSTLLNYVNNEVKRLEGKSEDSSVVSADLSMLNNEYNKMLAAMDADKDLSKLDKSNMLNKIAKSKGINVNENKSILSNVIKPDKSSNKSFSKRTIVTSSIRKPTKKNTSPIEFDSSELGGVSELSTYVNEMVAKGSESSDSGPIGNEDIAALNKVCDRFIRDGHKNKGAKKSESKVSRNNEEQQPDDNTKNE